MGDIVSRFGAIDAIQGTLTSQFVTAILDGLMALLTLVVLVIYSPELTAIILAASVLYAISRLAYFRVLREANLSQITVRAKQQTGLMEAIRGVQTIRLNNQGAAQSARYLNLTTDAINTSIAVQRQNLIFGTLNSAVTGMQRIAVLWLGAWIALKGEFSAGMLMAFASYADQFTSRTASLIDYAIQIRLLRLQGERLADIMLTQPELNSEGPYMGPSPEASIKFENVSFRYADGDPWVIRGCSFEIKAGEFVAITGPSGSGKTTLARLLLGLLDPQHGVIRVGGIDIRHLGKTAYRKMIGSVLQDDILFSGTIADNISFHDEKITIDKVEAAARAAELHADVIRMPMGYNTLVGDMGSSLSGGQKQRLYLARALYRCPSLLVLDEATSNIDAACEGRIQSAIKGMGVTRIAIAHRAETLRAATRVLVCINGQIIDQSNLQKTSPEQEVLSQQIA
jgi:ATP-binding cassette subfamily B protein RaxB